MRRVYSIAGEGTIKKDMTPTRSSPIGEYPTDAKTLAMQLDGY